MIEMDNVISTIEHPLNTIADRMIHRDFNGIPMFDLEPVITSVQPSPPNGQDSSDNKSPGIKDKDVNNYIAPKKSVTKDMTGEQLLMHICKFADNIFLLDPTENQRITPDTSYVQEGQSKIITIENIMFEVNRILCKGVRIIQRKEDDAFKYTASIQYVAQDEDYWNGPAYTIIVNKPTLQDVISHIHEKLKKMQRCDTCKTVVYDSSISEHCIICLFSDYFTKDNDLITCVICSEQTRDFTTLQCGHRFDHACLSKINNRVCPLCREPFAIS